MKKSEKTAHTKERILAAAIEAFGEYGYNGATVNQICQSHTISKGLIYHNYKNKDDLYLHCVAFAVSDFISFMSQHEIGADLQKYMLLRYRFFEENPLLGRIIFEVILQYPVCTDEKIQRLKSEFNCYNLTLYTRAIHMLKLRDGVTEDDAVQYYDMLQNMLNSYLTGGDTEPDGFRAAIRRHEEQLHKILNFMLYGIAENN